jgi:hypothetical protein
MLCISSVPADAALVGFDDLEFASTMDWQEQELEAQLSARGVYCAHGHV